MLYMGYQMSAHEAQQYGLVSQVYNHDALEKVWDYLNKVSTLSSEVLFFFNTSYVVYWYIHTARM